jgi:hypothetical protein
VLTYEKLGIRKERKTVRIQVEDSMKEAEFSNGREGSAKGFAVGQSAGFEIGGSIFLKRRRFQELEAPTGEADPGGGICVRLPRELDGQLVSQTPRLPRLTVQK